MLHKPTYSWKVNITLLDQKLSEVKISKLPKMVWFYTWIVEYGMENGLVVRTR